MGDFVDDFCCQCLPIVAPIGLVMVPTTPMHCVVDVTLAHWDTVKLAHWDTRTLGHWHTGTLRQYPGVGRLVHWDTEAVGHWHTGTL